MARIPLIVNTSEYKQFTCFYLKNKTFFLDFFWRFSNLHLISNIFKEKMTLIPYVFPKLLTTKYVLR